jgi:hypothetical protein
MEKEVKNVEVNAIDLKEHAKELCKIAKRLIKPVDDDDNEWELYFKYCSRDDFFDKLSYFNPEWISLILIAIPLVLEERQKSGYTKEMLNDIRGKMNALIEFLVTILHNRNEIDSMGNEVYQIRKILEF